MESPQRTFETPVKKNQSPLIVAISAVVLCCCCVVLAVAGYYGYNTIRIAETEFEPLDEPTQEFQGTDPEPTDVFELPNTDLGVGEAPTGGRGNDILRNDTWQYVAFAAMGHGCDEPIGEESTIEVLQEPENGVWVEKWTVACTSGDKYDFEVEFILDSTGTTFNIRSLP